MQTEISMMGTGRTTRPTDSGSTATWMAPSTKESGKKTSSMGTEKKHGLTALATRETMWTEGSTDKGCSLGQTEAPTKASFTRIILREEASTSGQMAGSTKASGATTKWRARACSPGQTGASTRATTSTIKKKAMECSSGLTGANTTDSGTTGSSTEWAFTRRLRERRRRESGRTESGWLGSAELLILVNLLGSSAFSLAPSLLARLGIPLCIVYVYGLGSLVLHCTAFLPTP